MIFAAVVSSSAATTFAIGTIPILALTGTGYPHYLGLPRCGHQRRTRVTILRRSDDPGYWRQREVARRELFTPASAQASWIGIA